jgi:hypothetical protein
MPVPRWARWVKKQGTDQVAASPGSSGLSAGERRIRVYAVRGATDAQPAGLPST